MAPPLTTPLLSLKCLPGRQVATLKLVKQFSGLKVRPPTDKTSIWASCHFTHHIQAFQQTLLKLRTFHWPRFAGALSASFFVFFPSRSTVRCSPLASNLLSNLMRPIRRSFHNFYARKWFYHQSVQLVRSQLELASSVRCPFKWIKMYILTVEKVQSRAS